MRMPQPIEQIHMGGSVSQMHHQFSINSALALKAINYFSAINKATKIYTQLQHIYLQHTHTQAHTHSQTATLTIHCIPLGANWGFH